jgi:hypothetical protein
MEITYLLGAVEGHMPYGRRFSYAEDVNWCDALRESERSGSWRWSSSVVDVRIG